jgi:hypothetical protein
MSANILTHRGPERKGFVGDFSTVRRRTLRYNPRVWSWSDYPDAKGAVADVLNTSNHKDLSELFHRLNNELGIILSHAELLEVKCAQEVNRSRASQVVAAALDAMGTARQIRTHVNDLTPAK